MSRRQMTPPSGAPRRHGRLGRHSVLILTARVLAQEVLIGAALYACAIAIRAAGLGTGAFAAMLALIWMLVLLWIRRFGLLRPQRWPTAFMEACLLYVGAICCTNIMLIELHSRLWTSRL